MRFYVSLCLGGLGWLLSLGMSVGAEEESSTEFELTMPAVDKNCNGIVASEEGLCTDMSRSKYGCSDNSEARVTRPCDDYAVSEKGVHGTCGPDLAEDRDNDGFGNGCDNCAETYNPDQKDADADGRGDACDNCPSIHNPDQASTMIGGLGDACIPGAAGGPDGSPGCSFGAAMVGSQQTSFEILGALGVGVLLLGSCLLIQNQRSWIRTIRA